MENKENNSIITEGPISSVEDSLLACLWKYKLVIGLSLVVTMSIELMIFFSGANSYFFPTAVWAFLLAGFCFNIQEGLKDNLMRQFAKANNFAYNESGKIEGVDDSNEAISNAIEGVCENYKISMFTYCYKAKHAECNRDTFFATVFMFGLDKKMPNMVLKEKGPSFKGIFSKNENGILQLEGNFNEYFELETEEGCETEALQIFTPDIMEDLIEKAKSFNMEIVNDHFFIYDRRMIGTKKEMYEFFEAAKYFMKKLGPKIERMRLS